MKRRILLVDFGIPFGGAEVYLGNLVRLLGDRVEFLAICVNPDLARLMRSLGVRVYSFVPALNWGKFAHTLIGCAAICYLRFRFQITDVWIQGVPEVALLPLAKLFRCKTVATQHYVLDPSVSRTLYPLFSWAVDKLICVSQAVADDCAGLVPSRKLVVIANWLPELPIKKSVKCRVQSNSCRILYVGRVEAFKGLPLLVDALRSVQGNHPTLSLQLVIVGSGSYEAQLRERSEGLDVIFIGFVQDPSSFYENADVFVYPSLGPEGMPMAPLEAMSNGVACILSDLPVHKEITGGGRFSFLFRSGHADDLAAQLERVVNCPELANRYGELGRSVIEEKHCAGAARQRYVNALSL